ncbi:MAG: malonyl-ACP O-methyltransferase BioC [Spongiibacteraceae bacterium]
MTPNSSDWSNRPGWYCERLPALNHSAEAGELVLLHGWASSSDIWRAWLPWLRRRANVTLLDLPGFGRTPAPDKSDPDTFYDLETLLTQLSAYVPEKAALLGWSLGGMLAAEFTARYPLRCGALITIATNAVYVAKADWPSAQTPEQFAEFRNGVATNTAVQLRKFQGLQVLGDSRERELLRTLRHMPSAQTAPDILDAGLQLLADMDVRDALKASRIPGLHMYGMNDALVPIGAADAVAQLVHNHWVIATEGAAHAPFLSQPELCWQHVDRALFEARLLKRLPASVRRKDAVAQSFSRAASTYDNAAGLQRHVAARLQAKLPEKIDGLLLDIGCGTGAITAQLVQKAPVVALDFARGMVSHGRLHNQNALIHWLCGDAENLPLATASVGAVFSSLAMQWCENLGAAFGEIARVLSVGGRATIATLGPDTLFELRAAWAAVDGHVHVNRFLAREQIEAALLASGLCIEAWDEEMVVQEYAELRELTRELKAIGAHNVNTGRPAGLTGRARLLAFSAAYEEQRNKAGNLPATYQVWYLTLTNTTPNASVAVGSERNA